ncbi:MAG: 50S ribosomal protein L10 [Leptospiraceae bacterium]|nr:50S ribosomal protein L10 [Leptospiraceae bacterium]
MAAPQKTEQLNELKEILSSQENFILTTYSGLSVTEITDLRGKIRGKDARFKVVKNTLFKRALQELDGFDEKLAESTSAVLKGPIAVAFAGAELPSIAKLLVDFGKTNDKVEIKAGCLEGQFLDQASVKAIANLPTKEELLVIIARGFNAPATKMAIGMKQIMSGLARGIQEIGKKNG